jgi:hypothetical protein
MKGNLVVVGDRDNLLQCMSKLLKISTSTLIGVTLDYLYNNINNTKLYTIYNSLYTHNIPSNYYLPNIIISLLRLNSNIDTSIGTEILPLMSYILGINIYLIVFKSIDLVSSILYEGTSDINPPSNYNNICIAYYINTSMFRPIYLNHGTTLSTTIPTRVIEECLGIANINSTYINQIVSTMIEHNNIIISGIKLNVVSEPKEIVNLLEVPSHTNVSTLINKLLSTKVDTLILNSKEGALMGILESLLPIRD